MKIILNPSQYTFNPTLNQIDFSALSGGFDSSHLYAVINVTTGKLVYATASAPAGYGGTFSGSVLTYASSNVGQSGTDTLQVIYDDPNANQTVSVTNPVSSYTFDYAGNAISSTSDPSSGQYALNVSTRTADAYGTPIGSTVDLASLKDGLDVNMLTSSYGGQVDQVMPPPFSDYALSIGILNDGTLRAPKMNINDQIEVDATNSGNVPVSIQESVVLSTNISNSGQQSMTYSIPVVIASDQTVTPHNISQFGGTGVSIGQQTMSASMPVTIASNQSAIPISTSSPITVNVNNGSATDVLGTAIVGNKNNQIEIDFNTLPSSSLLTYSTTGSGTASATGSGSSLFQAGTVLGASSSKAVSVYNVSYRAGNEIYSQFTASFTNSSPTGYMRIGLYDASNGFFIGNNGSGFGVTKRASGSDTFTVQTSFNTDTLSGGGSSKFTRNGVPEAINWSYANLFRIRFAWLGSANIYFEVFSPDGQWVIFHNIRQPNTSATPSIANPNLPMTVEVARTSGSTNLTIGTACWSAGSTSALQPITATLTDNTLASVNRSVITGVTTGGGGGYVNVKVAPSGALVADVSNSTGLGVSSLPPLPAGSNTIGSINNISGTITLPTGASTSALQTTGNTSLSSIDGKMTNTGSGLKVDGSGVTQPVSAVSLPLPSGASTSALQNTGNTSLSSIDTKTPALGSAVIASSTPVNIASDQTVPTNITKFAGTAVAIGQQAMASSIPVVLPSDMGNMPMSMPDLFITGQSAQTATVNNIIPATAGASATDASGYRSGTIQVVSTGTAGTFAFESSNDNVNWQALPVINSALANGTIINGAITATASSIIYAFPITGRYIRLRIATTITGGSIQAFTRLSQNPYTASTQAVGQATGTNLNVAIASGTVTTVSTVTTCSTVTSASLASATITDIASAAISTTTTSANLATTNQQTFSVQIAVTVVSGTSPTLDVVIQETIDGTNYYDVYHFERITATGNYWSPPIKVSGIGLRYVRTVGGTTPSFTMSAVRIHRSAPASMFRRVFDRTIAPNTLNSTTPSVFVEECDMIQLVVSSGAGATVNPVIKCQGSDDNSNWYDLNGMSISATPSSTLSADSGLSEALPKFIRAIVSTAGTGATLNYVSLKGKSSS